MEKTSTLERTPAVGAGPLGAELVVLSGELRRYQYRIVVAAAAFADSPEWVLDGSPTAAHWLASVADVEACTAREWIRIGKALATLPVTETAFAERRLSYSTVRTLTRTATPENEAQLVDLVTGVPAAEVGKVVAAWMHRSLPPEDIAARQRASRSVKWRTEADGMVVFTLRLQPTSHPATTDATTHRRPETASAVPIDVAAMPHSHDVDHETRIDDLVNEPVVTHSNPIHRVLSGESDTVRWPWFVREEIDRGTDAFVAPCVGVRRSP